MQFSIHAFPYFPEPSDQRSENIDKKSCDEEVESSKSSEDKSVEHCENLAFISTLTCIIIHNLDFYMLNLVSIYTQIVADLQEGFKNKLMMYAQRKGLKKPAYCSGKEGQCFKARVSVGEDWFTSNELCATAEEAETSAAATALLALLTDAFHEVKVVTKLI